MKRIIALLIGAWMTYCAMKGDWDGAVMIAFTYWLTARMDPFDLNKKSDSAANTDAQNK